MVVEHYGLGWRHILAVLAFVGFFNTYMLRFNMSVALVAMVNQTAVQIQTKQENADQNLSNQLTCYEGSSKENLSENHQRKTFVEGPFFWDEAQQASVLSSFFYGYFITQLPGGWIAYRLSGKWVLGMGLLVTSVMTLLTPVAASAGVGLLMAVRAVEGLAEGVLFPAMHSMLGRWVPPLERSKLPTVVYSGTYVGTIVTFGVSGFLAASFWGWPSIFYISGIIGCSWCVLWFIIVSDTPKQHRWISSAERDYIESSIQAEHSIRR